VGENLFTARDTTRDESKEDDVVARATRAIVKGT
jgi:hypothetical protein